MYSNDLDESHQYDKWNKTVINARFVVQIALTKVQTSKCRLGKA